MVQTVTQLKLWTLILRMMQWKSSGKNAMMMGMYLRM